MPAAIRAVVLSAAAIGAWFPLYASAQENVIPVTTEADVIDPLDGKCSLREAVITANTNMLNSAVANECPKGSGNVVDVIVLQAGEIYALTRVGDGVAAGDLDIAADPDLAAGVTAIHIKGTSEDNRPIIRQTVAERVLDIDSENVVLSNLIIEGGADSDGGGIQNTDGVLSLEHVIVQKNHADDEGGGIRSTGRVTLYRSNIFDNDADVRGGGIFQLEGKLSLTDSTVHSNSAFFGGGIYGDTTLLEIFPGCHFLQNSAGSNGAGILNIRGSLIIDDAVFIGNIATNFGGAIRDNDAFSTTYITNTDFINNGAADGGAIHQISDAIQLHISGSRFNGNDASNNGGAISGNFIQIESTAFTANTAAANGGAVYSQELTDITRTTFRGNSAMRGGALHVDNAYLSSSIVDHNASELAGGGIHASGTFLYVFDSRISNNSTPGDGGGIWISQPANAFASLDRILVDGNIAEGNGGGIWVSGDGTLAIPNTTSSGNQSNGPGSGIFIDDSASVRMTNSTFVADSPGASIAKYGTLEMKNSIVSNPSGDDCIASLGNPYIASLGNNLSDDGTCLGLDAFMDTMNVDALLAPLAYTSGKTMTHALLPGSPAIDHGDALACAEAPINGIDQRGAARDVGLGCDIGAHEQGAIVSMTMFGDGFE